MATTKNPARKNLILFLTFATLFSGCMPRGQRALRAGRELIERGRYNEAIERLKLATSSMSTNAQAWNYLGLAYHHAGQADNAAQAYEAALARHHDLMEAHFNLGCLRLEQDRLADAGAEFTAYTVRRGDSPEGWLKLGTVQLRLRDFPAAGMSFKKALAHSPQNPEALNGLGLIQLHRHRSPRDAAHLFSKALEQQPGYAPALLNLAVVAQVHLNDRALALRNYRAYLAAAGSDPKRDEVAAVIRGLEPETVTPASPAATTSTPPARAKAPEPKVASTGSSRAPVQAKPESATNAAKVALASTSAVVQAGLPSSAALVKSNPPMSTPRATPAAARPQPSGTLAMAPNASGRQAQSGSHDSPDKLDPSNTMRGELKPATPVPSPSRPESPAVSSIGTQSTLPGTAGSVLRYRYLSPAAPRPGDHSAAVAACVEGTRALETGRLAEAVAAYRRAMQLDPAYYDVYYNLGQAETQAGNLREALTVYETALAIRPESLEARYNFALVLKRANYPMDAAAELEKILAVSPRDSRAHLALGNLFARQLGQPTKAREHYLKVLDMDPRNPQAPAIRYWLAANRP